MNNEEPEQITLQHTHRLKARLLVLIERLRQDVSTVNDPRAQVLFNTSAEVLTGLMKAFADFEHQTESAWQVPGKPDAKDTWPRQDAPLK